MWIVANNTVDGRMFALEQLFVLLMMLNKAIFSINLFGAAADMTVATCLRITIQAHIDGQRIAGPLIEGKPDPIEGQPDAQPAPRHVYCRLFKKGIPQNVKALAELGMAMETEQAADILREGDADIPYPAEAFRQ